MPDLRSSHAHAKVPKPEMMASEMNPEQLRAMAEHRGFKLLRSRKRTPGVGDFGKFGLTDGNGKPLIGVGDDGLMASAAEVEDYLRGGALSSWKRSAEEVPEPPSRQVKRKRRSSEDADGSEGPAPRKRATDAAPRREVAAPSRRQNPPPPRATPVLRLVEAAPAPTLRIRRAAAGDANDLSTLLAQLRRGPKDSAIAANLAQLRKAGGDLVIADLGGPVGCCAWAAVPTLQHGRVGRITLLLVDRKHRRRGIGTALLAAADKALIKAKCRQVEAMSDVMIDNAHGFFRAMKFEQASYRFVRTIDAGGD
jgi:ribosomal protein S18 acetylase RimI-like enzyme